MERSVILSPGTTLRVPLAELQADAVEIFSYGTIILVSVLVSVLKFILLTVLLTVN